MLKLKDVKKMVTLSNTHSNIKPKPRDKNNHVGVEIECFIPYRKDEARAILAYYFTQLGLDNKVRIGNDGSLRGVKLKHYYTAEIRVIDTEKNIFKTITQVCLVLNKIKAFVNKSCGLHVHLDMRNYKEEEQKKIFHNLYMSQNLLFSLVKKDRQKNRYCKKIGKTMTISGGMQWTTNPSGQGMWTYPKPRRVKIDYAVLKQYAGRRYAINLKSLEEHNTIEVRLHHGTINALAINKWIAILLRIAKKDKIAKELPTKKEGLKELGL